MSRREAASCVIPLLLLVALPACEGDVVVPPDLLATLQIDAEPEAARYRAGDSVRFTITDAGGAAPARVEWAVLPDGPNGESQDGEFTHRFESVGTFTVFVRAEFADGRAGEAGLEVEVDGNVAPSVVVSGLPGVPRVPLGEELVLVAEAADPDDPAESLAVEWLEVVAGEVVSVAAGDTLRITASEPGVHWFAARATDPHGADAVYPVGLETYDPLTPFAWRTRVGAGHASLTLLEGGAIAFHDGYKLEGSARVCGCVVAAFDPDGTALWTYETASAGAPYPAGMAGGLYLARAELVALGGDGVELWQSDPAVLGSVVHGGAVLPDGTLLQTVGFGSERYVRAVSPAGVPGPLSAVLPGQRTAALLAERDGRTYVLAPGYSLDGRPASVTALDAAGNLLWTLAGQRTNGEIAFGPDSLVLFSLHDSLTAIRKGGQIAWRIQLQQRTVGPLSGDDGLIYAFAGGALHALDPATGASVRKLPIPFQATGEAVLAANGVIYVAADLRVQGVDTGTGSVVWQHESAGPVSTLLLTPDGLLVLVDRHGYMEAVEVGTGPSAGPWPMAAGGPHRRSVRGEP